MARSPRDPARPARQRARFRVCARAHALHSTTKRTLNHDASPRGTETSGARARAGPLSRFGMKTSTERRTLRVVRSCVYTSHGSPPLHPFACDSTWNLARGSSSGHTGKHSRAAQSGVTDWATLRRSPRLYSALAARLDPAQSARAAAPGRQAAARAKGTARARAAPRRAAMPSLHALCASIRRVAYGARLHDSESRQSSPCLHLPHARQRRSCSITPRRTVATSIQSCPTARAARARPSSSATTASNRTTAPTITAPREPRQARHTPRPIALPERPSGPVRRRPHTRTPDASQEPRPTRTAQIPSAPR